MEKPPEPRPLPAQRAAKGIEEYVEGVLAKNDFGEYFLARQAFPFGRPYGKLRIGDISTADLSPLNLLFPQAALPAPERLVYLDTETTGLAGGTGTCAFLIGIGTVEGTQFVVRQFFLRDYPEEKAVLRALAEILDSFDGLVTYNGKTFDVPLLETRYALARLKSPFGRLLHLDALHPSRRLWRLRLESCKLTDLESAVLGIEREGDVAGSEIPGIYFDYLRTGRRARPATGVLPQRARYHDARRRHRGVGAGDRRRRARSILPWTSSASAACLKSRVQGNSRSRLASARFPADCRKKSRPERCTSWPCSTSGSANTNWRWRLGSNSRGGRPRWLSKPSRSWPFITSTTSAIPKSAMEFTLAALERLERRGAPCGRPGRALQGCPLPNRCRNASPTAWKGCNER